MWVFSTFIDSSASQPHLFLLTAILPQLQPPPTSTETAGHQTQDEETQVSPVHSSRPERRVWNWRYQFHALLFYI